MSELTMTKVPYGLTPSTDLDREIFEGDKIALGEKCRVKITRPRNLAFHNKYFALLGHTFHMQDKYNNMKHWRDAVLIAAGWCDTFITHEGKVNYKPASISFASCDETEFDRIYNDSIQAICDHWVDSEPEQIKLILEFM